MFTNYSFTVMERFLRYVQIDTQSDPQSTSCPSTEKQKDLSRVLVQELQQMGYSDAHLDDHGYVYATRS
ncbi:MAG TPA: peptidase T, partial [Niastella sp.]